MKNLRKLESFMKKVEKSCLNLLTVVEMLRLLKNDLVCRILFNLMGLNSSVVELFIGFLTSGLGFVNYC